MTSRDTHETARRHPVGLAALLLFLSCWLPSPQAVAADSLTLTGQVTDEDSRPVAGARIEILRPESRWEEGRRELAGDDRRTLATAVTNRAGRYRVEVPEPGFYEISADAEGRVSHSFEVGPVTGDEVVGDAILTPAETVTVRVVDDAGAPLSGARVAVVGDGGARVSRRGPFPARLNRTPRQSARTGEDGTTHFKRREGETLAVTAMAPGYAAGRLQDAAASTLTVRLERGEELPVEVLSADGEPVAGAVVGVGSPGVAVGRTGDDGRLTLTRDPKRGARVTVFAEDGGWARGTVEARLAEADSAGAETTAEEASAAEGASTQPLVLTLPPRFAIAGQALGEGTREPVPGAWLWVSSTSHRPARSDSRGNFTFELPQQGRPVYLRADGPGHDATVAQLRPAQATGDEPVTLLLKPTISASGRVIDSAGRPVAWAEVWAESLDGRVPLVEAGDESFTDADGGFHLAELTADTRFTLHARQDGFAPGSHDLKAVPAGSTAAGLEIVLPAAITAFGRVVDLDEIPVAGAEITLVPAPENDFFALVGQHQTQGDPPFATAGTDGGFEFTDLPQGRFNLSAEAGGFAPLAVPGIELPEPGTRLDLGTLVLEPGLRLEGRVVDPAGRGIEGARVIGRPAGLFGMGAMRFGSEDDAVETGPDGRFVLADLARGRGLDVSARADGYTQQHLAGVEVPSDEPVTLELTPAATLSGIVVDSNGAPVERAMVRIDVKAESGHPSARYGSHDFSDAEGHFTVKDVHPGRVDAIVSAAGFLHFGERGIEVVSGEDLEGLRFELERGHTVGGRVLDSTGRPLPEARVSLVQSPGAGFSAGGLATTDADGVYELTAVAAGEHSLAAEHQGFLRRVRDLTVVAGENRLDFRLQPGLSVSGRVVDEAGSPVAGASVALVGGSSFPNLMGGDVGERSGEGGDFRIEGVEPGAYKIAATKVGYVTRVTEEPVEVTADSPVTGLELRLARGAVVRGRLLGAELSELANATVMAIALDTQDLMPVMASVDYEGRFRLEGVSEGGWRLMAVLGTGQPAGSEEFNVGAGESELVVDLDVGQSEASLRGRVRLGGEPLTNAMITLQGQGTSMAGFGRTDHQGRFEIRSLADGTYDMTMLRLGGGQSYSRSVEIRGDTELDLDIPVSTVEGVVLAEGGPVEGATVHLRTIDEAAALQVPATATTDRAGRFRLTRLPAGTYRVRGEAPGHSPGEIEVAVEEGVSTTGLEIRLGPGSSLELVVSTPYGSIPERVRVTAVDPSRAGSPADDPLGGGPSPVFSDVLATGEGGRIRLDGLPAGRWSLLVTSNNTAVARLEVTSPGPPVAVSLPRAHVLTARVPTLEDAGRLGRVWLTGGDGRPFLQPGYLDAPSSNWPLHNGKALITGLPAGRWTVTASTPDGRTWTGSVVTAGGAPAELVLE